MEPGNHFALWINHDIQIVRHRHTDSLPPSPEEVYEERVAAAIEAHHNLVGIDVFRSKGLRMNLPRDKFFLRIDFIYDTHGQRCTSVSRKFCARNAVITTPEYSDSNSTLSGPG